MDIPQIQTYTFDVKLPEYEVQELHHQYHYYKCQMLLL